MIRKSKCVGLVVVGLGLVLAVRAHCGNELRPGEVIWEYGDYAWRSLVVPTPEGPDEYDYDPIVVATDPDGNKWMIAGYEVKRFDGVEFELLKNMPTDNEAQLAIAHDRISGENYAAWIRGVRHLWPKGTESYVTRWEDGLYGWWYPHTPEYPGRYGFLSEVAIDSSGLVWMIGGLYFGSEYGVFCVDGDPNLDESWSFVEFPAVNTFYIDCGGGKCDRCILGFDGCGIGWVDEGTTSGTLIDLEALGGSNDIKDIAIGVCDHTVWVACEDGIFGYACEGDDCRMIESHTPAEDGWKSIWRIAVDDAGNVWVECRLGLLRYKDDVWRQFPFPSEFARNSGGFAVDTDRVPWARAYRYPALPSDLQLALYWQDCKVQVRTDRSEYEAGDSVEMTWSLKNLGPTVTGALYVGVVTPWGDVMCWAIDGWRPGLFPVLAEASYIPGLMFKPITFATVLITESTPPGEYSLATAIVGTSGKIEAYHECSFTVCQRYGSGS